MMDEIPCVLSLSPMHDNRAFEAWWGKTSFAKSKSMTAVDKMIAEIAWAGAINATQMFLNGDLEAGDER